MDVQNFLAKHPYEPCYRVNFTNTGAQVLVTQLQLDDYLSVRRSWEPPIRIEALL